MLAYTDTEWVDDMYECGPGVLACITLCLPLSSFQYTLDASENVPLANPPNGIM